MSTEGKADWLAIIIHFVVAMVVVGPLTYLSIACNRRMAAAFPYIRENAVWIALCVSVALGALYALLQEELRGEDGYKALPPLPAAHSRVSRGLLVFTIFFASLLLVLFLWPR